MATWITEEVELYRAGQRSWEQLLELLAGADYPDPERLTTRPADPFALEETDPDHDDDGTWDEVVRCRDSGLLLAEEYLAIVDRAAQLRPSNV